MGGKNSAPPPPDYSGIAAASEASAKYAYDLGKDQLAWAKEQYAQDKATADRVIDASMKTQDLNNEAAAADRARYQSIYQPLEDTLVADARDYASPGRKDQDMARAAAVTAQQFEGQRVAAQQSLESYGIDPSSTRFAALDIGVRASKAAAMAAAANQAGQATDATGRALRSEAINVGRGYPGQVAGTYATALNAGRSAVDSGLATTASGANTMGTAQGWQGMGNQAIGTWGNTLNQGYQNQMAQYQANQSSSSGLGSALGMAGGLAMMAMMEDGGTVPAANGPTQGGAVPVSASPSRGAIPDDVNARLTPDEFVIPRDVLKWKGEEFFQNTIKKAREARPQAQARPRAAAVPMSQQGAPAFTSRPVQASAIPMG